MRCDGVEIKVSLGGGPAVGAALGVLGLDRPGDTRAITFLEDATAGAALPLFRSGVVLRVRERADGSGDSTVKLRPGRRSQLSAHWLDAVKGDGWDLRVEEDWAAGRRVLAASCVADLPKGRIAEVRGGAPIRALFKAGQERFLAECGGITVNLDAVTLLPAVSSTKWSKVVVGGVADVAAERWTHGELDFLELSVRTGSAEAAPGVQAALDGAVEQLQLTRDDADASKTAKLLAFLVGS